MQREPVRSATVYNAGPSAGVQKEIQWLSGLGYGHLDPKQSFAEFEWYLRWDVLRGLRFEQRNGESRDGPEVTAHERPDAGAVPARSARKYRDPGASWVSLPVHREQITAMTGWDYGFLGRRGVEPPGPGRGASLGVMSLLR
jgi:hypothetical protein